MRELKSEGVFDRDTRLAISENFAELCGAVGPVVSGRSPLYVDTVDGWPYGDGSAAKPFQTMAAAFAVLRSRDTIYLRGKVREQLVAPLGVYGVRIIGADTNPRHDLAASWMPPTSPASTTPLLQLREQGWVIANLLFVPPDDAAAVKLSRRESATYPDASHAMFLNCRFAGGFIGIEDDGGAFNVKVFGCTFMLHTGVGGGAIVSTSTTIAAPYKWEIRQNVFQSNVNHIVMPFNKAIITNNIFVAASTAVINLTGGTAPNVVTYNQFDIAAADFDPAGGVTGVTGDLWHSLLKDGFETGLPAN